MRAAIHVNGSEHQQRAAYAMRAGLWRHGVEGQFGSIGDVVITWGARRSEPWQLGRPVLVMERGHVGDRMAWTSCGWDGLGRRGRYPAAPDAGRWQRDHGHLMRPWVEGGGGDVLLIGQVEGDAAIAGMGDVLEWAARIARELEGLGWAVRYRPHPLAPRTPVPAGVRVTRGRTLAEDLAGASRCVTFNSTAGVEAVLAGVPTVTLDPGAMAWPVATHELESPPITPDRTRWAADLAWTQWTLAEIAAGEAWEALAPLLPNGNRPIVAPLPIGALGSSQTLTGASR